MIMLADFFPGGVVRFVPPPFDERYWATFGIPARVRTDLWGGSMARGLQYKSTSDIGDTVSRSTLRRWDTVFKIAVECSRKCPETKADLKTFRL
jgi:hypothetical protein